VFPGQAEVFIRDDVGHICLLTVMQAGNTRSYGSDFNAASEDEMYGS
jgi:hypothetical protein